MRRGQRGGERRWEKKKRRKCSFSVGDLFLSVSAWRSVPLPTSMDHDFNTRSRSWAANPFTKAYTTLWVLAVQKNAEKKKLGEKKFLINMRMKGTRESEPTMTMNCVLWKVHGHPLHGIINFVREISLLLLYILVPPSTLSSFIFCLVIIPFSIIFFVTIIIMSSSHQFSSVEFASLFLYSHSFLDIFT